MIKPILLLINAWIGFTLTFYYFGPASWEGHSSPVVAFVVICSIFAFNVGAFVGHRWTVNGLVWRLQLHNPMLRFGVIAFHIISYAILIYVLTGRNMFLPTAYSLDFGDVYKSFHEGLVESSNRETMLYQLTALARAFIAPLIWIVLIQAIIKKQTKTTILVIFPYIAASFMRSTDKEIFDILIVLFSVYVLNGRIGKNFFRFSVIGVGAVFLFLERKVARFGGALPECMPTLPICTNRGDFFSVTMPESINYLYMFLASYLTQGYEGMHYALQQQFNPQFGLGTFKPIGRVSCRIFDVACEPMHFEAQTTAANGWDMSYHWSTAFTALANDVHWFGLPILFGVFGVLFGFTVKSWHHHRDLLSIICLALFGLFFFYISLNMQLSVTLEWTVVTIFFFGLQFLRLLAVRRTSTGREFVGSSGYLRYRKD